MPTVPTVDLYVDDTGSRHPDHADAVHRHDGMDAFALGGIIVDSERAPELHELHRSLVESFGLTTPLHSHKIRTRAKQFAWLGEDADRAARFYAGLNDLMVRIPAHVLACVVSRPGYNERYKAMYGAQRWRLCRSAYGILVERAAKWSVARGRRLAIYIERTAKVEDATLTGYHRELHEHGAYFDPTRSAQYQPLDARAMQRVIFKNPNFVTKENPWVQIADLVLYAVVKGKYDPAYPPYQLLVKSQKLIDFYVADPAQLGIKYYCFDQPAPSVFVPPESSPAAERR